FGIWRERVWRARSRAAARVPAPTRGDSYRRRSAPVIAARLWKNAATGDIAKLLQTSPVPVALIECKVLQRRKALDSIAIGRSRVLPGRELVIERGDLVQPIDDLFVGHRGCVTTSPFRFFAEERGISRNRGVRQRVIHIDLTFA